MEFKQIKLIFIGAVGMTIFIIFQIISDDTGVPQTGKKRRKLEEAYLPDNLFSNSEISSWAFILYILGEEI